MRSLNVFVHSPLDATLAFKTLPSGRVTHMHTSTYAHTDIDVYTHTCTHAQGHKQMVSGVLWPRFLKMCVCVLVYVCVCLFVCVHV